MHDLMKKLALAGVLVLPAMAGAQTPPPAAKAPTTLPKDAAGFQELADELEHFQWAARDYKATVNHIVRREYAERRKQLALKYDAQAAVEEKEERARRLQAIQMHEAFLAKYPNDQRWSPDVIFRLAELYFEKSEDEFLTAQDAYDKAQAAGKSDVPAPPDKPDYSKTIALYKRLIAQFPTYRQLDGAEYLMGYCYGEMGNKEESKQAFLSLVCSNRFKPLDTYQSPAAPPKGQKTAHAEEDIYRGCQPAKKDSKFLAEAWARLGEYHFASNELDASIATFTRVLAFKDSPLYDKALYKLAWSYYRADRFPEAIKRFDELVMWSDQHQQESEDKKQGGSKLRPEAVQYLGVSFAEEDWDGDHVPDKESGLQRIESFYRGREAQKHVREIYRRLGDIYFDQTKYQDAIAVYNVMLQKWPNDADAPNVQVQIVKGYDRQQDFKNAMVARESLARNYGKGTPWATHNADNPDAINNARALAEGSLADAAIYHHTRAQQLKTEYRDTKNKELLPEIKKEYALAGELYQKYLERYPNSKEAYEQSWNYAEDLYYGENYAQAAIQYSKIRDSNLNDTHREEAAFGAIKALEQVVAQAIQQKQIEDPPIPDTKNTKAPIQAKPMPQQVKDLQGAYDWYATRYKNQKASEIAYTSALLSMKYLNWDGEDGAEKRMINITERFCNTPEGPKASGAVAMIYTVNSNDEKLGAWTNAHANSKCGAGEGVQNAINDIRFKRAQDALEKGDCENAGPIFLELVNKFPTDQNADKALNNAAVCFEKVHRYNEATKAYEKLHEQYPNSQFDEEALYRAGLNHERFFEFNDAVARYLVIATAPKYKSSSHKVEALGKAAVLLENDQQYARAADLYKQYASIAPKPDEAAAAYYRAALVYEKMKDRSKEKQTLKDFISKYGGLHTQDPSTKIVQAHFKLGEIADAEHNKTEAEHEYKKVVEEFRNRALPAGSDAAEAAAKVEFAQVEKKYAAFKALPFKAANTKAIKASYTTMETQAKALVSEYEHIWNYKRVNWTLGAFERKGDIYFEFSQKISRSETPEEIKKLAKKAGPDAMIVENYRQGLESTLQPLEQKAQEYWKTTLDKAAELGVANEWSELARKQLNAYQPEQFPLVRDARVEIEQEDVK